MDLVVLSPTEAEFAGMRYRCVLGRGGVKRAKVEGDGATPAGTFPLRRVLYRPDRLDPPRSALPRLALRARHGWCDDPRDPAYNTLVPLPYDARCEKLWRDDALYDLIIVVGYNDAPVVSGRGSAIFVHLADADWRPTQGCVAFRRGDLLEIAAGLDRASQLIVPPSLEPGAH